MSGVLNQALGYEKQLPERDARKLEAILNECPALEFGLDGTDCKINRPQDKENYVDQVMETACGLHHFRLDHRRSKFA